MSWVDKNWKPLTVVGGLLGLSWFAGKRFEDAETFDAERRTWLRKCDVCGDNPIYEEDVEDENYDESIDVCEECFNELFTLDAETFDAERIKYDFIVHREPKGTKIGKDGKRIPNPKGGWFKSVKGAETFEAYDSMMQNRIDRNECSHSYDEGDSRGGDAWVLKYADLMGVEDGMSYIEAGVKCGICGQERIGSWGINEREGFQITKGEEGRMPRVYGWGYYGAEPNERSE